ncbi:MAG: serpin family protein [Actinomycetota bacterium]
MARSRWHPVAVALLALLAASCGARESSTEADAGTDVPTSAPSQDDAGMVAVTVAVPGRSSSIGDASLAGSAVTGFAYDLFSAARSDAEGSNLTVSPMSVAVALSMVEPGAVDSARQQLQTVLGISDPEAFHAAMNALEQDLEARTPGRFGSDDDPGEITIGVANAAYLQQGYPFESSYLEAIGSNYGPVLHEVDFPSDPDAVAREINDFVAQATNDQITDLVADGVIRPETVLALVNALYLKASWLETFDPALTTDDTFTLLDGTNVTVPIMHGSSSSSAQGDGWIGATKSYVGNLQAEFILPDEGRFDDVADDLAAVFREFDQNRTAGAALGLPKLETRTSIELTPTLRTLGLTAPFENGGLLGVADDPRLVVDQVVHETFVAMDEDGTEAAAATVVLVYATSGPPKPPVPVVLDRPYLYRIVDAATGATLFIGQVLDPTA